MEIFSLENKIFLHTFVPSFYIIKKDNRILMKKIIAFGGSTSSTSINKQLATYVSTLVESAEATVADMNNYQAVLYSSDEEQKGFPENLVAFSEELKSYDGFIISLAEHNGSYAAAFKNTLDWLSRINRTIFNEKPVLLMATSPGGRGGASVLASASAYFPHAGASKVISFSLPKFYENFQEGKIVDEELKNALGKSVQEFQESL